MRWWQNINSGKAPYPPPWSATMGGVPPSNFPVFFKKGVKMEETNKLQKEVHSVVLGLLRQGFTLQSVIHALIVESEKLSESAAVVEAINEFNQKP
jgi:hypothetical protein